MADENKVLENEVVAGTETTPSTPEITGDFNYDYSKIDSISGVEIPDETNGCKSLLQLAAMAYNMSNKQTAYSQAAFKKYVSVINDIVEKYNGRISKNENQLSEHEDKITELQQLVGNLPLDETTSLMEATQQLVKVLFNDNNYQDGITTGSGNGIINNHETRIGTLEADKVTYNYSGTDDTKTHKIEITHTDTSNNEDTNKTDIYTAKAVDARIAAFKTELENNSSSVGSGSTQTGDKYIKGQVDTSGLTAGTDSNPLSFQTEKENFLMSEGAIVSTLNSLINALENNLKKMAENFGKFLATFQLEDAVVYNGELFCTRKIKGTSSDWWKAVAPSGGLITISDSTTIGTKQYALVKYTSTYTKDKLPFEVSAYIPNETESMADIKSIKTLVPLGIFFGGNITWGELTTDEYLWKSENVVYYVTDREESYITNGSQTPAIFTKGKKGDQGPQGISIESIKGGDSSSSESGKTNTYTIVLKNPATGDTDESNTFSVTNGYGFRYIGTLTIEHESKLPTTPGDSYPTAITSDWDASSSGKSVQLNDYVIITDSFGNKIKVFNGTKWQEMIKGVTSSAIIPVYTKDSTSFTQIGHLRSAADYTTAKSQLLELAGNNEGNLYYTTDAFVTSDSNWLQITSGVLSNQATAIKIQII